MQVSISKAAEMVGVTRATLYRHIDKKGISVEKDEEGNPKIDVSELLRVYGDKVTPLEKLKNTEDGVSNKQDDTGINTSNNTGLKTEVEVLKERIKNLELERSKNNEERVRERELLNDQIEMLKERIETSDEQQKRLTLLLTDQTSQKEERAGEQEKKLDELVKANEMLRKQNRRFLYELKSQQELSLWEKLFGKRDTVKRKYSN